jgi:hypothetical protein
MRFTKYCFIFILPLFAFASSSSNPYAECFIYNFRESNFTQSSRLLDEWEFMEPAEKNKINGLRAAIFLAAGALDEGALFIGKFAQNLSAEELANPMINFVIRLYEHVFSVSLLESAFLHEIPCLCEREKNEETKLKCAIGIAKILADFLANPLAHDATIRAHERTLTECFAMCDEHRDAHELAKLICYAICVFTCKK